MRNIILALLVLLTVNSVKGQEENLSKNTINVELLGQGFLYSLNYDRLLYKHGGVSFTAGLGFAYWPYSEGWNDYEGLLLPFQVNTLLGKGNHKLEAGVGFTPLIGKDVPNNTSHAKLFSNFRFGYRYQRAQGGFFYKLSFTPFLGEKNVNSVKKTGLFPWFGTALGWTF